MEVADEEFGEMLVTLRQGDSLKAVPRSHRRLVTAEIEAWWADPLRAIRGVADRAVTPNMGRWFRRMSDDGTRRLKLHQVPHGATRAGYWLSCPGVRGRRLSLPRRSRRSSTCCPVCRTTTAWWGTSIGWGSWRPAGSTAWKGTHLTAFGFDYRRAGVEPARTFAFGWSPGGDMLIYTSDGRGGWLCHENGEIRLLGSVLDTLDWVYGELLAGRCPDFPAGG